MQKSVLKMRVSLFLLSLIFILTGCGAEAVVQHNSECATVSAHPSIVKKPLSEFVSMYPDALSEEDLILQELNGEVSSQFVELYDSDKIAITNINPGYTKLSLDVMTPKDVRDVVISLRYNTGEIVSLYISLIPESQLVRASVDMPANAESVQLLSFDYSETNVNVLNVYDLGTRDCKKYKRKSNNTIAFECENTRVLLLSEYGVILDDVTLDGSGTFTTAHAVTRIVEVEENNGS